MRAGLRLSGRYVLEALLGSGGMGEVWRARDELLDRPVAVKVLRAEFTDPELAERFRREARIAARLQHPGITVVHDVGYDAGRMLMVMELLQGRDLQSVLDDSPAGLPVDEVISLGIQAAGALQAAHAAQVVHRDLKPANLFLATGGQLKICDFGIARALDGTTNLTAADQIIGTAAYMSPEQCLGRPIDQRSDLYALGCVLYALLAGSPPFTGAAVPVVIASHVNADPPPLLAARPDVPAEVDRLVARLLAKDPADRPADAGVVAAALQAIALRAARPAPPAPAAPAPRTMAPGTPAYTEHRGAPMPAGDAGPAQANRNSAGALQADPRHAIPSRTGRRSPARIRWALGAGVPVMIAAAVLGVYLSGSAAGAHSPGPSVSQSARSQGPSATQATQTQSASPSASPTEPVPLSAASVVVDHPASGASVQQCAVFSGRATLPQDYTLVLAMLNTADPLKALYLEAVQDWDKPADLAHWTGYQYFGSGDTSVGQTYAVSAVIIPAATVKTALANPANRPTWHVTTLPQGSVIKKTLRVTRVHGPGPKACQ